MLESIAFTAKVIWALSIYTYNTLTWMFTLTSWIHDMDTYNVYSISWKMKINKKHKM